MIHYSNLLKGHKSILCLDGTLPEADFFVGSNLPLIAADGAANKLANINITPSVIIGDLDSIDPAQYKHSKIIHKPDQATSDFQKALDYIEKNNLLPTIVTGVNGGFIDHILNNINIVIEKRCSFYAPPIIGYVLSSPLVFNLKLNLSTKLSLFGMHKAKVTTTGLKWDLDNAMLDFPGANSSFNRTIAEDISIAVTTGTLLLLVYNQDINDMGLLS